MTALYAFDGASPFDLAAAKAAGGIAITVYIRGTPGGYPHADAARVTEARTVHGLGVSPNWESTSDYFGTCSLQEALWAGTDGLAACRALGFPDTGTIACSFSFDFDVPASRFPEMGSKVQQITLGLAGHYKTMIYGQQALIDYLVAHGYLTGKQWLMMSTFGQPYDPASPNVCMVQGHDLAGNWINPGPVAGTDINTVTDPHALGAWWPDGSPYSTGDDMSAADVQAITAYIDKVLPGARLAKIDTLAYEMSAQVAPAVAAIRANTLTPAPSVAAIASAVVAALPAVNFTPAQVTDLAAAIAAALPSATPPKFAVTSQVTAL